MEDKKCVYCDRKTSEGYTVYKSKQTGEMLCKKHAKHIHKYGKIRRTIYDKNEIIIKEKYAEMVLYNTKGEEIGKTLIDLDDVERVKHFKWSLSNKGKDWNYVIRNINKSINTDYIMLHKFITNTEKETIVDHINRNKLDNRKSNLRIVNFSQNGMNKSKQSNNTSGYTGVFFNNQSKRWVANISINNKTKRLGSFKNIHDAVKARLLGEKEYFKEYAPQKHLFEKYGIECDIHE